MLTVDRPALKRTTPRAPTNTAVPWHQLVDRHLTSVRIRLRSFTDLSKPRFKATNDGAHQPTQPCFFSSQSPPTSSSRPCLACLQGICLCPGVNGDLAIKITARIGRAPSGWSVGWIGDPSSISHGTAASGLNEGGERGGMEHEPDRLVLLLPCGPFLARVSLSLISSLVIVCVSWAV